MEILWEELTVGLPDSRQLIHVVIRLLASVILGAIIGYQRERVGKPAGLRTHILVTLGTTIFVLACTGYGMSSDGVSRVIQGIITGIGFVGAGSIIKSDKEGSVQGLTSSAGIWVAAGIGVAVGLGGLGLALMSTFLAFIILTFVNSLEYRIHTKQPYQTHEDKE
jgi:putative Mg2+ transporter-C (MgtC) family protein